MLSKLLSKHYVSYEEALDEPLKYLTHLSRHISPAKSWPSSPSPILLLRILKPPFLLEYFKEEVLFYLNTSRLLSFPFFQSSRTILYAQGGKRKS